MNETDRKRIISNLRSLSDKIVYEQLRDYCRQLGIINQTMISEIEKHNENGETKNNRLLTKLTKRGPKAFDVLLSICVRAFPDAFKILQPSSMHMGEMRDCEHGFLPSNHPVFPTTDHVHSTDKGNRPAPQLVPYKEEVEPHKNMPKFVYSTKIHMSTDIQTYPMQSKNRGVLFFVNIIHFSNMDPRHGAHMDRNNLIWLFRQMGFQIFYYEDLVFTELEHLIEQLIHSQYLRCTDSFVFALMTHGSHEEGKEFVQFSDGGHVNIKNIICKFYNDRCEKLRNKPKIFILPFCRGKRPDQGVVVQSRVKTDATVVAVAVAAQSRDETDRVVVAVEVSPSRVETDSMAMSDSMAEVPRKLPTKSDIIICYGTVQGFETHRDTHDGSWYVQELCKVFAEHAHDKELYSMLQMIMARIMNQYRTADNYNLQTPAIENMGFYKALYFNPGHSKKSE